MQLTRKSFLGAGIATAAFSAVSSPADQSVKPVGQRRMRLGVLSDLHITDAASTEPFEAVLRIFDREKVDGVVVCGDLTDFGTETQLKLLADAWFKVFPDGKRSDGEPVANLMHYGDHDICDKTYRDRKKCVNLYPDEEAMKKVLADIQDGTFAKDFLLDMSPAGGQAHFKALRRKAAEHPSEAVGKQIRSLYSWSEDDKLINN
jgi:hypothetical protein